MGHAQLRPVGQLALPAIQMAIWPTETTTFSPLSDSNNQSCINTRALQHCLHGQNLTRLGLGDKELQSRAHETENCSFINP
jgi:hypothetical protein